MHDIFVLTNNFVNANSKQVLQLMERRRRSQLPLQRLLPAVAS